MTSPHCRGRHRYAWLIATIALASCASHPPVRDVDESVRQLRAEYLHAYPDGEFTRNIERGEIALGMRFEDVVASWGIPDARERSAGKDRERWTYTITDAWSGDWVRYDFVFREDMLAAWETMRNVASSHMLSGGTSIVPPLPAAPGAAGLVSGGAPRR